MQEASQCVKMLLTKSQACAHQGTIKHHQGPIYLRPVMSGVLSGENQGLDKVRGEQ